MSHTPQSLCAAIVAALSGVEPQASHMLRALDALRSANGVAPVLLSIVQQREQVPVHVRLFACVTLRRIVEQRWRPHADNAAIELDAGEKAVLRAGVGGMLAESDGRIAEAFALMVGAMARVDFPRYWPDVVPALAAQIVDGSLTSMRAAQYLRRVVRALCSRRLQEALAQLRAHAVPLFGGVARVWATCLQQGVPALGVTAELSRLLSLLVREAFQTLPAPVVQWAQGLTVLVNQLYAQHATNADACAVIRSAQKVFVSCVEHHAPSCGAAVGHMVELCCSIVEQLPADAFLHVRALELLKHALVLAYPTVEHAGTNWGDSDGSYADSDEDDNDGDKQEDASSAAATAGKQEAVRACTTVLSDARVRSLAALLLGRFMPLTHGELRLWDDEPEAFSDDDAHTSRGTAEAFLLALLDHRRAAMVQVLQEACVRAWHPEAAASTGSGLASALFEDGVLRLMGLGEYALNEVPGLATALLQRCAGVLEPRSTDATQRSGDAAWARRVLVRRAAWVISCWRPHLTGAQRAALYPMLLHHVSLSSGASVVSSLAAAQCLQSLIDDVAFEADVFVPYLQGALAALFSLLSACSDTENKKLVVQALSSTMNACSEHLQPFIAQLVPGLMGMWQQAHGELVFESIVMACYGVVVEALDVDCESFVRSVCVPCVQHAMAATGDAASLVEDGLMLWKTCVAYVPSLLPELVQCAALLRGLVHRSFVLESAEHLGALVKLVRTYALIGGASFVSSYQDVLADTIGTVVQTVRAVHAVPAVALASMLVQAHGDSVAAVVRVLLADTVAFVFNSEEHATMRAASGVLAARLALHAPRLFDEWCAVAASRLGSARWPCDVLIEVWEELLDHATSLEDRRALVFAACKLVMEQMSLANRVGGAVNMAAQVAFDQFETPEAHNAGIPQKKHSALAVAMFQMRGTDPVARQDLLALVSAMLQRLRAQPSTAAAVAAVDPALLQQLQVAVQQQQQKQAPPQWDA